MTTRNSEIARRFLVEVWAKGDPAAMEELVDENFVLRDTMGTDIQGIAKLRAMVQKMLSCFSNTRFDIEEMIEVGDRVVIRHTWHGTHRGDFYGVKGSGNAVQSMAVDILRLRDGKVVEDYGYWDSYSMFQQLGVLPERDHLMKVAEEQQPAQHA